jgi:hypothetical protein
MTEISFGQESFAQKCKHDFNSAASPEEKLSAVSDF